MSKVIDYGVIRWHSRGREDFFETAVRHWVDGAVLEENKEYDNAVCMQGFAAECALKAILEKGIAQQETVDEIVKKYSHRTDILKNRGKINGYIQ